MTTRLSSSRPTLNQPNNELLILRKDVLTGNLGVTGLIEKTRSIAVNQLKQIARIYIQINRESVLNSGPIEEMSYISMQKESISAINQSRRCIPDELKDRLRKHGRDALKNVYKYKAMLNELRVINLELAFLKLPKLKP